MKHALGLIYENLLVIQIEIAIYVYFFYYFLTKAYQCIQSTIQNLKKMSLKVPNGIQ